jgi:hypothetical protein
MLFPIANLLDGYSDKFYASADSNVDSGAIASEKRKALYHAAFIFLKLLILIGDFDICDFGYDIIYEV